MRDIIIRNTALKDSDTICYKFPVFPYAIYTNNIMVTHYVVYRKNKQTKIIKEMINELSKKHCSKNLIDELNELILNLKNIPHEYGYLDK